jgi:hypothetical protein
MTTLVFKGPADAEKVAQFKKVARAMGYTLKPEPAKKLRATTKVAQDFIEAYEEMKAAERGEVKLRDFKEVLEELRAEQRINS